MFAPHPQVATKEMIRLIGPAKHIAFSTWVSELINGKLFKVMAKHIPVPPLPTTSNNQLQQQKIFPSLMQ
jgi:hypothetical protein